MSQAEALLNSLTETGIGHAHVVPDSDTHFIIDPNTRQIENTNYQKTVLMQGDHNSERFTFEIPRYVDGHDMSLCNRVIVHFDNVGLTLSDIHSDVAYMNDLRINPDKPDTVISSWLIRREATQIVGILSFSLQYQCIENDEVTYEWNTDSYDGIEIRKSKNNSEAAIIEYTNVLEQWRAQIFGAGDTVMSNITTEGANQVAAVKSESATQQSAIELKGSDTLESIPTNYTDLYNLANEAARTKADSIICVAEGEAVAIHNSSDDNVRGLTVYGKTTQITTTGAQLIDAARIETATMNGITLTNNDDGSFTISGNTTLTDTFAKYYEYTHEETVNLLRAGPMKLITERTTNPYIYAQMVVDSVVVGTISNYKNKTEEIDILQEWLDNTTSFLRIGFFGKTDANTSVGVSTRPMVYQVGDGVWEPFTGGKVTPNPEYPQELVNIENPTIEVTGKNIISAYNVRYSGSGLTVDMAEDGGIRFNGTADTRVIVYFIQSEERKNLPLGTYTLSVGSVLPDGVSCIFERYVGAKWDGIITRIASGTSHSTVTLADTTNVAFYLAINEGVTVDNLIVYPQLEIGNVVTSFEKSINLQTCNVNGSLRAIPVTSGGNYTDSNGQQWICDEVDFERGVYIQRTRERVYNGSEPWGYNTNVGVQNSGIFTITISDMKKVYDDSTTKSLCDCYKIANDLPIANYEYYCRDSYFGINQVAFRNDSFTDVSEWKTYLADHPITVLYMLASPIETPLTADEIMTYKSLRTHYPNTTIMNDAGAQMKVKYNADTKLFIAEMADNRAASLVEEILNDTY